MIEVDYLKLLGFTNFVFGRKVDRDGKERLSWINSIDINTFLIVRLVENCDKWEVEIFKISKGQEEIDLKKLFRVDLKDVVNLLEKLGYNPSTDSNLSDSETCD